MNAAVRGSSNPAAGLTEQSMIRIGEGGLWTVPAALPYVGGRAFADFEENVSLKPENWFVQAREGADLPSIVKGAQLAKADLRHLSGERAFLMKREPLLPSTAKSSRLIAS